jgi:ribonuclease T1
VTRFTAFLRLALLLALAGFCGLNTALYAREKHHDSPIVWVALSELPSEAHRTLQLIRGSGPYPFPHKDGSTFGNFEKHLPYKVRGYYREYTVLTPGSRDRGARRIIAGEGSTGNVATSGEYYYTDDHYRSFRRIREP